VRGWGRLCPVSGRIRPPLGRAAIADLWRSCMMHCKPCAS